MLFSVPKVVLALSPHVDDADFGCGGTLARMVEQGAEVHLAAFSLCEQSVPRHLPKDVLATELQAAAKCLGLDSSRVRTFGFEVRTFPEHRQRILDTLIGLKGEIGPDCVLLPCGSDTHQDHATIAAEGFRAFKDSTLLGYEMPWNSLVFSSTAFSVLEERHLVKKIAAISSYESQKHRPYASSDYIRSLALTRGVQIKRALAEVFEVVRLVF